MSLQSVLTAVCALTLTVANAAEPDLREQIHGDQMPDWAPRSEHKEGDATKNNCWIIKDGVLQCAANGRLWGVWFGTDANYTDFIIDFDYKMSPGSNSGVYLRCPPTGHPSTVAVEIQLLDDTAEQYAKLTPSQFTGSIYKLAAPTRRNAKPLGEWNHMRITARGEHITVVQNEATILDADGKTCPELRKRCHRGAIGFQDHHTPVWFRNVRIADLSPATQPAFASSQAATSQPASTRPANRKAAILD